MRLRTLVLRFVAGYLIIGAGLAQAQEASDRVRAAIRHVVTVQAQDVEGAPIGLGSGFLLSDGRVATNSHVVEGAARVEILDASGVTLGSATHAEAVDTVLDLAVLPGIGARAGLSLETSYPEVGSQVWVLGSPRGLVASLSTGIVSAIRTVGGRTLIQISAPISPGSSGGPVLNASGEVIGITVGTMPDGQNLNFAVPSSYLSTLLLSQPAANPFPVPKSRPDPTPPSERWLYYGSAANPEADYFYDPQSGYERLGIAHVWVRTEYHSEQRNGDEHYDSVSALYQIRCNRRQFRIVELVLRSHDEVLENYPIQLYYGPWQSVSPESLGETLLTRAC